MFGNFRDEDSMQSYLYNNRIKFKNLNFFTLWYAFN